MKFPSHAHLSVDDWMTLSSPDAFSSMIHSKKERIIDENISILFDSSNYTGWDDAMGMFLILGGTAMLIPGPIDIAAGAAGLAIFKHPAGAVAGVAAYNVLALAIMAVGYGLIELD